jgi:hypothetical protein
MGRLKKQLHEVLRLSTEKEASSTLHRYYRAWREQNGLTIERCDIKECIYHSSPMTWNGKPLKPILDHISGNPKDNEPANLRFLCPNCDSQQPTRGGGNKGRIKTISETGSYYEKNKDGTQAAHVSGVHLVVKAHLQSGKPCGK